MWLKPFTFRVVHFIAIGNFTCSHILPSSLSSLGHLFISSYFILVFSPLWFSLAGHRGHTFLQLSEGSKHLLKFHSSYCLHFWVIKMKFPFSCSAVHLFLIDQVECFPFLFIFKLKEIYQDSVLATNKMFPWFPHHSFGTIWNPFSYLLQQGFWGFYVLWRSQPNSHGLTFF